MSKNEPLVSVIILNYNAGELLSKCVESILKSNYQNVEIIVVDNVSTDNSHKKCKEKFGKIKLIENSKNIGFCDGNNVGIKEALGEFVIIINPDTTVEPDWIDELFKAYEEFGEGIFQPKILSLDDKRILQSTGNMIHLFGFGYSRDLGIIDKNYRDEIEKVGYAAGTCLFTTSKVIKKVGLLDSFIFLYHDDVDFGWRAAQLGISSYYVPKSKIYHVKSYNLKWSAEKFYWLERNRKYCVLTHYSEKTLEKMKVSLFIVDVLVWFAYIFKGFAKSKIRADSDIKRNIELIKKRQKELESIKKISDTELIAEFPDTIFLSNNVSGGISSRIFNSIITRLSKSTKKSLFK